jgi:thiol:disulfide interchange protein DsbC
MRISISRLAVAAALAIASSGACAAPDDLTSRLAPKIASVLGKAPIEKVSPTTHAGLYEVLTPNGIVYTDKTGSFVVFGPLVDTATKTNLTKKRLDEQSKFDFKELPLRDAIKAVKGDGSRVIATLEDPNCGYCKKLMQELAKIDNITIYTFLVPILGPDSLVKSTAIWCASDPSKAWNDFMSGAAALPSQPNTQCATPFARNESLQRKLRVTGTPTILFRDNSKEPGYMTAQELEARLKK